LREKPDLIPVLSETRRSGQLPNEYHLARELSSGAALSAAAAGLRNISQSWASHLARKLSKHLRRNAAEGPERTFERISADEGSIWLLDQERRAGGYLQ
jgi:hypothetical protein